jgi:hypothetical protein
MGGSRKADELTAGQAAPTVAVGGRHAEAGSSGSVGNGPDERKSARLRMTGTDPAETAVARLAAEVASALSAAGTRLLFGIPGGGLNLDVIGAAERMGIRFVLVHSETSATIMAATFAELSGTAGACVVTRGPGLASAANGLAHATGSPL